MPDQKIKIFICFTLIFAGLGIIFIAPTHSLVSAQQPTGSVPTVTGTPSGMIVQVNIDTSNEIVNVYSGPNTNYPSIGVILMGQEIPAFGISQDGDWIQIYYPGVPGSVAWVFGPYVKIIKNGKLPVLPAPPTPTPASTPTINPTLEAAFIPQVTITHLPTFTAAPEIIAATFLPDEQANRVPAGFLILALGFIGGFGTLISFLRRR